MNNKQFRQLIVSQTHTTKQTRSAMHQWA